MNNSDLRKRRFINFLEDFDWEVAWYLLCTIVLIAGLIWGGAGLLGAFKDVGNYQWCQSNYIYEDAPEVVKLYAGDNSYQLDGNWNILGGDLETKDTVSYWTDDNGVLSKHDVPMKQSTFIEDGENELLVFTPVCWEFPEHKINGNVKYEFHVPQGSVVRMYIFK